LPAEQDHPLAKWSGAEGEWYIEMTNAGRAPITVAFAGQFTLRPSFSGTPGDYFEACLEPIGISLRDNHTLCELEPARGDSFFDVWVELDAVENPRWAPPIEVSRIQVGPSAAREMLDVELQFRAAPPFGDLPLDAFYREFQVESSPAMRAGTWRKLGDSVPAGPANSYEWKGTVELNSTFMRIMSLKGESE
jgi:hypothetical protein